MYISKLYELKKLYKACIFKDIIKKVCIKYSLTVDKSYLRFYNMVYFFKE